jgi:ribonuclease E
VTADVTAAEAPTEPEAPRVVTRTRRRSASRPAGPPALPAVSGAGTVPVSGVVEPALVDVEPGSGTPLAEAQEATSEAASEATSEAPAVEHVPVKRKGSRKR